MKIQAITISGMHAVSRQTYSFQNLNYLYGPNGAGKSTVLQAIQLVILGYVPGTAKNVSNIFQHANGPEMKIHIDFDNSKYIERTWQMKGRNIDSKVDSNLGLENLADIVGDLELPIFNFQELIGMTANKLKDWFINFLPNASEEIDWGNELKQSLDGLNLMDDTLISTTLDQVEDVSKDSSSTIELIQRLNQLWKDEMSYLKTELKRTEGTIQSLVFYDEDDLQGDTEYLQDEIEKARASIQSLTTSKENLIRATQVIQSNQNIRNQLEGLPEEANTEKLSEEQSSLLDKSAEIQNDISSIEASIQTISQQGYEIEADIRAKSAIITSKGICPYTQSSCDSIVSLVKKFQSEVDELNGRKKDLQSQINEKQNSLQNKKLELNKINSRLNQLNAEIAQVKSAKASRERLTALLANEPDMSQFKDLNYYTTKIEENNARITKIEANKQYSSLIDSLTVEKYKTENTIEAYKCWVKLTDPNGLQTKVMDAPFKDLADEMTRYLSIMFSSDEIECKFNLEQKANSFSFGINRNGKYISYDLLSSGEKTMYTLALMLCIISKSSSQVKLLIADDMLDHLDDDRANEVFGAISKIEDIQVIIAGVKDSSNAKDYMIKVE